MMENSNNELENLYRNAAENFPLMNNSANWQAVLEQLEEEDKEKFFWLNRKTIYYALLLSIISLGSVFIVTKITPNNIELKKSFESKAETEKQLAEIKSRNKNLESTIENRVYKRIIDSISKTNVAIYKNKIAVKQEDNHNVNEQQKVTLLTKKSKVSEIKSEPFYNLKKNQFARVAKTNNTNSFRNDAEFDLMKSSLKIQKTILDKKPSYKSLEALAAFELEHEQKLSPGTLKGNRVDSSKTLVALENKPASAIGLSTKSSYKKSFYIGLMVAPQQSSVAFEPRNNDGDDVGFNLSFLIGYKLSKRISIESGFNFQSKEYYSCSNRFNSNVLPTKGNLINVEAENRLIEIPLSLRFDLLNKSAHSFFSTIGISSYIVNKEAYEYEQEINGVEVEKSIAYRNTTSNFLGACNLSIGYQYQLKKHGSIRVQPYLSLPINGVGIGNQPIVSKGVYFGWIYNFKH